MALAGARLTRQPNTPDEEFREPRAHGEILLMVDGADACVFGL